MSSKRFKTMNKNKIKHPNQNKKYFNQNQKIIPKEVFLNIQIQKI